MCTATSLLSLGSEAHGPECDRAEEYTANGFLCIAQDRLEPLASAALGDSCRQIFQRPDSIQGPSSKGVQRQQSVMQCNFAAYSSPFYVNAWVGQ